MTTENNRKPQDKTLTNISPFKDRLPIYRNLAKVLKQHNILKRGSLNSLCLSSLELILEITNNEPQLAKTLLPKLSELEQQFAIATNTKTPGRKKRKQSQD